MDAEALADKARNSISSFCINECKAYCCRKGHLVIKEDEIDEVMQGREAELENEGALTRTKDGRYSLNLDNSNEGCPSLKDNKCTIHKSSKRPKVCGDFPIFIEGNKVRFSGRCTAVQEGKFYPYVKKFLAMGFKVEEGDRMYDSDFYKVVDDLNKNN